MEMNQISIIQRDLRLERWFLKVQFPTRSCISSPSPPFRLSGKFSQTFVPDQNILLISSLLDASEIMTDLFWHWIKKVQDPKGLEEEGKSRLLASFFFFFSLLALASFHFRPLRPVQPNFKGASLAYSLFVLFCFQSFYQNLRSKSLFDLIFYTHISLRDLLVKSKQVLYFFSISTYYHLILTQITSCLQLLLYFNIEDKNTGKKEIFLLTDR